MFPVMTPLHLQLKIQSLIMLFVLLIPNFFQVHHLMYLLLQLYWITEVMKNIVLLSKPIIIEHYLTLLLLK